MLLEKLNCPEVLLWYISEKEVQRLLGGLKFCNLGTFGGFEMYLWIFLG